MQKTIDMGTDLLPWFLRPNTYGNDDDFDYQIKEELNEDDKKFTGEEVMNALEEYYDTIKREEYFDFVFQQFKEILEWWFIDWLREKSNGAFVDLKCKGTLKRPQYYNYGGDWINFDLTVDDEKLQSLLDTLDKWELKIFLAEEYSSRDWFMSQTADNVEEFYLWLKDWRYQEFGALICFLCKDIEPRDYDFFIDYCGHYTQFASKERADKRLA